MEPFAELGYAEVTVRQIASAAGVSPALVIHHYGSKDKLRAVLEERIAAFVESMLAELARAPEQGGSSTVAELFASRLDREPAMAGYVRRLLVDGGPAGVALYERLFGATRAGMQELQQAGVVRPALDERLRSAFLLGNDLAMLLLLRPHIWQVVGIDPLARDGLARWSAGAFDVYANGLFVPAPAASQAKDPPMQRPQRGADRVTPAIETFGLTNRYGATTAAADLTLRIEPGQVFGFLAPNGAGKSTTIPMLLALQRPTRGPGHLDAAADSIEIHRRTGYLPGDFELFPRLTGRQHIAWFGRVRGGVDHSALKQLADRFQVVTDHPVRELSKGSRQKIGLVLVFMHRPELLFSTSRQRGSTR